MGVAFTLMLTAMRVLELFSIHVVMGAVIAVCTNKISAHVVGRVEGCSCRSSNLICDVAR